MSDVTQILNQIEQGDPRAAEQLLPLVYEELRRLAQHRLSREPARHDLQATGLVHEAYLRLVGAGEPDWNNRGHFFGAASRAMRRILVDRARHAASLKAGGDRQRLGLSQIEAPVADKSIDLVALDEALDSLEQHDVRAFSVVQLRYFGGLTIAETAQTLGVSTSTVENDWVYAKAWLKRQVQAQ